MPKKPTTKEVDAAMAALAPPSLRDEIVRRIDMVVDLRQPHKEMLELSTKADKLIITPSTEGVATDLGIKLKMLKEGLDTDRKKMLEPFQTLVSVVNGRYKTLTSMAEDSLTSLRVRIIAAREKAVMNPKKSTTVHNKSAGSLGSATGVSHWAFEIVDEKKVPDMFWIINELAISKSIQAGVRDIAGVRIFEKKTVAFGKK